MSGSKQKVRWQPLGSKLGRRIFFYSAWLVCSVTLIDALFSAWLSFENEKSAQKHRVEETLVKLEPSLSHAAWNINNIGVQIVLDALSTMQGVSAVSFSGELHYLHSPKEMSLPQSQWSCDDLLVREIIERQSANNTLSMGELRVCINYDVLAADFTKAFLALVLPQLFAVFVTVLGFWGMTHWLVLSRIAVISSHLQGNERAKELPELTEDDELGLLDRELLNKTKSLLAERDLTRTIIDRTPTSMVLTDDCYVVLRTNPAFDRLIPVVSDHNKAARLDEFLPEVRNLEPNAWQKLDRLPAPASDKYIEAYTFDFEIPSIEIGKCKLFVFRDLTVIKRMERETLHANRMSAIGSLTSGIAHDFNNILAIISGSAEIALMDRTLSANSRKLVEKIEYSAGRGTSLTDKLLTFSRRQNLQESLIVPHEIIQNVVELSKTMIGPSVILSLRSEANSAVWADEAYLESSLINLIINARDAITVGGEIEIAVEDSVRDGQQVVVFSVMDNGAGIPQDILDKVLEPFFTTKKAGDGTGLGLSMVAGFVEQSGGWLNIDSEPGRTKVSISLPVASNGANKASGAAQQNQVEASLSGLQVAIIDDEDAFSSVLCTYLNDLGANTVSFTKLPELIEQSDRTHFDLYLCDLILIGKTGLDVWDYVQKHDPAANFIFMSGKVPDELRSAVDATGVPVIIKPFKLVDLIRLIPKRRQA